MIKVVEIKLVIVTDSNTKEISLHNDIINAISNSGAILKIFTKEIKSPGSFEILEAEV